MDKETLQKKIESGETVWTFSWTTGEKRIVELNLQENEPETDNYLLYFWDKDLVEHRYGLESIFATKKEAEWELEFGNITRTEKLELPTWEQALEQSLEVGIGTTFVDAHKGKWQLIFAKDEIILCDWSLMSRDKSWKKLTHENYLEACRLCKKLFLGEEL